jgi:hypothetical protein
MVLELIERDPVEVVAARPEPAGEARAPCLDLAVAGGLEVIPARVDPIPGIPDRDRDGYQSRDRQHGEPDVAGTRHPRAAS